MPDTRYPYTYACDLIRSKGGYGANGTNISRSNASQIRHLFSEVLGLDDEAVAKRLADYYLKHQAEITEQSVKDYQLAQEYHNKLEAERG